MLTISIQLKVMNIAKNDLNGDCCFYLQYFLSSVRLKHICLCNDLNRGTDGQIMVIYRMLDVFYGLSSKNMGKYFLGLI